MRIIIDLDGVICPIRKNNERYEDLEPLFGAVEKLQKIKEQGNYIIISTARNMATCNSNIGLVNKNIAEITLNWLKRHKIVYDEIYFGKPNGEIYIDDRAIRFTSWELITDELLISQSKLK